MPSSLLLHRQAVRLALALFLVLSVLSGCAPARAALHQGETSASAASPAPAAALGPVVEPAPPALALAPLSGDLAMQHVRHLAGEIGPRPAASAASTTAAAYIAGVFGAYGYEVERQGFTFPQFEERRTALAVTPQGSAGAPASPPVSLPAHALIYSAAGDVSGRLVFAGFGRPEDLPADGIRGAIALMERGAQVTFRQKAETAARAGAAGAIIYNSAPHEFTGSLQVQSSIPVVALSGDDGRRLRDLLAQGALMARLEVDAGIEQRPAENVIATRRGPSDGGAARTVVIGAHYDSVPASPGANDNASGTALMLEMARVLAAEPPPATLKFIAFGAEELGLLGSAHYVRALAASERSAIAAMVNFDMVGVGDALLVGGDDGVIRLAQQVAGEQGLQLGRLGGSLASSSDHASFIAAGIPSGFFHVFDDPNYHTPGDVAEAVSPERMHQMGTIGVEVIRRLAGS